MTQLHERTLSQEIDVGAPDLIAIDDAWTGYSPHSPMVASYQLRRGETGTFEGTGVLSTRLAGKQEVPVRLSTLAAKKFLGALGGVTLRWGPYTPFQDHTDDYPRIQVVLYTPGSGAVMLYTSSQGKFHAPWAVFVTGQAWVVDGDDIGRALEALSRPLHRRELDRMADPRRQTPR